MKRLLSIAVLACAGLSGCVVAPVGRGYYGHGRPVVVAPAPPVVVVRPGHPGYPGYGGPGWYGDGRGWRRGY